ncbi:Maf-like protein [Cytophaga hutchinsonii]|uniref:dTTP/UTP pyrophosphatase n=1 Tax=Cytophaga hutchinsonii (strain ATCC 33406 / DSM 1761 / CIP 103989 / NBRC 15051 / NCIMB 9469 / D465) TaxID=269798 RepID=NTPPA_CYTH3|nr:Maf-like protein [Cytophaga hutchinsonii]Q11VI6.1 RecName: Full=dTTP/UTP pyrophosphatase; Short=dTTPase/UTPase; AltName: Full=Nucleoside triphosphate pyrophosphatase; AltName: Full=Nucleotide pyrophosphatase; Short=Nucleotide PPase [Cytophaga hutchinsonii ATCC 33406]ABG58580.1 Maf-like protein [Cytophaga hutchinsonii ATCC 33406]SFX77511.1 septum formation protein [Cytophaga hutchinsonii ATCC 33406]
MFINHLHNTDIILASGSPRRKQLLEDAGINFRIHTKNVEENYPVYLQRSEIPLYLSKIKAHAVKADFPDSLIIAADTIVVQRRDVFNKPGSAEEAKDMLRKLSNNMHEVITGVTICYGEKERSFYDITEVFFKPLSETYINYYIENHKPFDKAGAYGIQEWLGMVGIKKIQGDFYNVMGLPVSKLIDELEKMFNPELELNQINSNRPEEPNKYLYFGI